MNYLIKAYRILNIKYQELKLITWIAIIMNFIFLIITLLLAYKVDYYKNENIKSINSCKRIIKELVNDKISISQV